MSGYDLLRLLIKFKKEKDANVWITILKNMHVLIKILAGTELFAKFSEYFADLLKDAVEFVGFQVNKNDCI